MSEVVGGSDPGMAKRDDRAKLISKGFGRLASSSVASQDLQCDQTIHASIVGEVDRPQTARPEFLANLIATIHRGQERWRTG